MAFHLSCNTILTADQGYLINEYTAPIHSSLTFPVHVDGNYFFFFFTGVIAFNGTQPIVLQFVGGQYSNGKGFSLRGRQIPCSKNESTDSRKAEVVEQRPHSPNNNGEEPRNNERVTLRGTEEAEAEWLDHLVDAGDMVLHWVGPGGPVDGPLINRKGLAQVPS